MKRELYMYKIISKNEKARSFIVIFFVLFCALVLIFNNMILFSDEDIYQYSLEEISVNECTIEENRYIPLTGNSSIQISLPETKVNNLRINFTEALTENITFTFYIQNNNNETIKMCSKTASIGANYIAVAFQSSSNSMISIGFDHTVPVDNITVKWKEINLLQKNYLWLTFLVISVMLSVILSLLIVRKKPLTKNNLILNANPRQSNYELLRIICMFFIIVHHCVVHGGILSSAYTTNKIIAGLFVSVGKICFIVFIAISMWFLVDSEFKFSKFMKLWIEVFFYSLSLTIITGIMTDTLTIQNFLGALFPIAGNSHGFASAYLMFYLLLPFLYKLTYKITKKQARYLLVLLFYAQIFTQVLGQITNCYQSLYSELTLFIFCYILTLNLKKWPVNILNDKKFLFLLLLAIYITLVEANWMTIWGRNNRIIDYILAISGSESSILIIIAGYSIFFLVKDLKIKYSSIINRIASYTFGILLIHDHNFLRAILWNYFVDVQRWYNSPLYFILLLISGGCIFFVCSAIDYCRQELLERPFVKSLVWKKICQKFDSII